MLLVWIQGQAQHSSLSHASHFFLINLLLQLLLLCHVHKLNSQGSVPLKAEAWEELLREADGLEELPEIPEGIRRGFKIGLEHYQLMKTFIPENHYTLPHHLEHICQKQDEEIELGRITKGYTLEELKALVGHFCTVPLSVIEKPSKLQTIINHSYPDQAKGIDPATTPHNTSKLIPLDPSTTSINTVLKSKKWNCNWETFLECYLLVADTPPGTEAAVFDADTTFQNIPYIHRHGLS